MGFGRQLGCTPTLAGASSAAGSGAAPPISEARDQLDAKAELLRRRTLVLRGFPTKMKGEAKVVNQEKT